MTLCICGVVPGVYCPQGSPPWTPANLGSQLLLWLDAQDTTTLYTDTTESTPATNGASVGRWKDKSGNNKHADQATGTKKPTRNDTGINSKLALTFDGGDGLATPSLATTGTSVEVYCVGRSLSGANNSYIESSANADSTAGSYRLIALTTQYMARCFGNVGLNDNRTASVDSLAHLFRATFDFTQTTNESNIYVDGTIGTARTSTSNNTGAFTSQVANIGARANTSLFLTGAIGEILICNSLLSPTDATLVASYLKSKWGTP